MGHTAIKFVFDFASIHCSSKETFSNCLKQTGRVDILVYLSSSPLIIQSTEAEDCCNILPLLVFCTQEVCKPDGGQAIFSPEYRLMRRSLESEYEFSFSSPGSQVYAGGRAVPQKMGLMS
jgi:hypothetical protein